MDREYYLKNKEKLKQQTKEWRIKNKERMQQTRRDYELRNKERIKANHRLWYLKNQQRQIEKCREYREKNREYFRENALNYYYKNQGEVLKKRKQIRDSQKSEVISAYTKGTMKCNICGIKGLEYLTIDHMNGGGTRHLKKVGRRFYIWLIDKKFPPGFQALCWNCNCVKGIYGLERLKSLLKET